jgi:hypothetical protein
MNYRKILADKLFDGYNYHEGKVLVIDGMGIVEEIIPIEDAGTDI